MTTSSPAISRVQRLRGLPFEESVIYQMLRFKVADATIIRNTDYARHVHQDVQPRFAFDGSGDTISEIEDDDLPSLPEGLPQVPRFEIVI